MKLAITGGNGYIASHLTRLALDNGHSVLTLSRKKSSQNSAEWMSYDLLSNEPIDLPKDIDVVVHLATSSIDSKSIYEKEILGATLLLDASRKAGAKFIFISSQTSSQDSPSLYGKLKFDIELLVQKFSGVIIRPGQVYGSKPQALFKRLIMIVAKLPLLPYFVKSPKIQPIHVDDLANGIIKICEITQNHKNIYCLGSTEPVSFNTFLKSICVNRLRIYRVFFPIPSFMLFPFIAIFGKFYPSLMQLHSLFVLPRMETEADLKSINLVLRPLASGMNKSGDGQTREILQEGLAFGRYLFNNYYSYSFLKSYLLAIKQLKGGRSLSLPPIFLKWPMFIYFIEINPFFKSKFLDELKSRIAITSLIMEARPSGANIFLGLGSKNTFLKSFFGIASALLSASLIRILATIASPVVYLKYKSLINSHHG
ncbi:NAD-dependent epimerase/dehydratase family protein [Polynucleobacter hallstattensis]|uniref:NAD-dependent epimerase/dehydratase family protein n=1 Tax=Polynucleobacter hallstattensis TaxID=1855586 RepID=UPI001C0E8027|nr:NAD(P)-dependent oxidoreductase [Polynucleobacter hallstattensis]MBU3560593.1 NAD(P)-dependent oxidoreductase [Polynucleobacter hallstattensis]